MNIKSLEQLNLISKKIANQLKVNDNIYLIGETGVGKTTFTRYLINNLQIKEGIEISEVLSPTFNLLYEYNFKNFKLMHYDLYRIQREDELDNLGLFSKDEDVIRVIEWPDLISTSVSEKLEIHFDYTKNKDERSIKLIGSDRWNNFK